MAIAMKCKVFSATKAREREELGQAVTTFLASAEVKKLVDKEVHQSSDNEFHCVTIVVWYE